MWDLYMPLLQLIIALVLSIFILVYRQNLGPNWLWVMKQILLWSLIARRIDEIGNVLGLDLMSPQVGWILAWLFLAAVTLSTYRLIKTGRLLRLHDQRIQQLERLRAQSENRSGDWGLEVKYPKLV